MKYILIVYHTQTGNTERLAKEVEKGVLESGEIKPVLKKAFDTDETDIKEASAIVICSPEYFGYMAGAIKDLFDRTYEKLRDDPKVFRKPYAIVISAGNDGTGALNHIKRICTGYRFRLVQPPLICKGGITEDCLKKAYEIGLALAEGIKLGIF